MNYFLFLFQEVANTKIVRLNGPRLPLLSAGDARTVTGTAYTRQSGMQL